MRAVVSAELGAAPSLVELDTPEPGPGEVRVRVYSSSLNGFDSAVVAGWMAGFMPHQFPVVLGRDFAGTIDRLGPDVDGFAEGDSVFGVVLTMPLQAGGFGEYVIVPRGSLARTPDGLDHATAGVLGLAGSAAVAVVGITAPAAGETLLLSGATGGVGNIVIQLAAARGAVVLATAMPGDEAAHVRALGADHVIDRTGDIAAQVRAVAPGGVDVAMHLAGDPLALADLVRPGGRFTSLLNVGPDQLGERDVDARPTNANPDPAELEELASRVVAGEVVVPVQRTYRLDDVPRAFADFAGGTLGKLAVAIE